MTQADTELPRGIETELVRVVDVATFGTGAVELLTERTLVDEGSGILGGRRVLGRRVDIQTHAEG